MSRLYAQLVILSLKASRPVPPSLQRYASSNGYTQRVQLRGARRIEAEEAAIAELIQNNERLSVYISPHETDMAGTGELQPFHDMYARFPPEQERVGCGIAVLDAYHNALLYHSLDPQKGPLLAKHAAAEHLEQFGWRTFSTREEAGQFLLEFMHSGTGRQVRTDAEPIDPALYQWLCKGLGRPIQELTELAGITELHAEDWLQASPKLPDWLRPVPRAWRILGRLPNLERLEFPRVSIADFSFLLFSRRLKYLDLRETNFYEGRYLEYLEDLETLFLPGAEFADFSFLKHCGKLAVLDVSRTNFSDCSLLLQLPTLNTVWLPSKWSLVHSEILEQLPAAVYTHEPEAEQSDPPAYYLSGEQLRLGANGWYAQRIEADGRVYQGDALTKKLVETLTLDIQEGRVRSITVSGDSDGETVVLAADIRDGWAAISLQDEWRGVFYAPYSRDHADQEEPAPPKAGGQSQVPKVQAMDDLRAAAACVRHYIETGKLSPVWTWVPIE